MIKLWIIFSLVFVVYTVRKGCEFPNTRFVGKVILRLICSTEEHIVQAERDCLNDERCIGVTVLTGLKEECVLYSRLDKLVPCDSCTSYETVCLESVFVWQEIRPLLVLQSSTYRDYIGSNSVDQDMQTWSRTNHQTNPWVGFFFQTEYVVQEIRFLYNNNVSDGDAETLHRDLAITAHSNLPPYTTRPACTFSECRKYICNFKCDWVPASTIFVTQESWDEEDSILIYEVEFTGFERPTNTENITMTFASFKETLDDFLTDDTGVAMSVLQQIQLVQHDWDAVVAVLMGPEMEQLRPEGLELEPSLYKHVVVFKEMIPEERRENVINLNNLFVMSLPETNQVVVSFTFDGTGYPLAHLLIHKQQDNSIASVSLDVCGDFDIPPGGRCGEMGSGERYWAMFVTKEELVLNCQGEELLRLVFAENCTVDTTALHYLLLDLGPHMLAEMDRLEVASMDIDLYYRADTYQDYSYEDDTPAMKEEVINRRCREIEEEVMVSCRDANIFNISGQGVEHIYDTIVEEFNRTAGKLLRDVHEQYTRDTAIQNFLTTSYPDILEQRYQDYINSEEGKAYIEAEYEKRTAEILHATRLMEFSTLTQLFTKNERYADSLAESLNYALMMWREGEPMTNPQTVEDLLQWLHTIVEVFKEELGSTGPPLAPHTSTPPPPQYASSGWWQFDENLLKHSAVPEQYTAHSAYPDQGWGIEPAFKWGPVWEPGPAVRRFLPVDTREPLHVDLQPEDPIHEDPMQPPWQPQTLNPAKYATDPLPPATQGEEGEEEEGEFPTEPVRRLTDEPLEVIYQRIIDAFVHQYNM